MKHYKKKNFMDIVTRMITIFNIIIKVLSKCAGNVRKVLRDALKSFHQVLY